MEKREGKKRGESREGERKEKRRKKTQSSTEILPDCESKGILTQPIVFLCYHHRSVFQARNQYIVSIE